MAPTVITLYSREGCHLCEEARLAIEALADELGGIELRELDIEADERLLRTHLERIPVIELDGREVSSLVLDPEALRAALELHTVGP